MCLVRFLAALTTLACLAGCTATASPPVSPPPATGPTGGTPGADGLVGRIPGIVRKLEPSVVTIFTDNSLGSGVVYRADGIILTNEHVVERQRRVQVAFADGKRVAGRVLARTWPRSGPRRHCLPGRADRDRVPALEPGLWPLAARSRPLLGQAASGREGLKGRPA